MKKLPLLFLFVFTIIYSPSFSQNVNRIIPQPQSISMGDGFFSFDENLVIINGEKGSFNYSYLAEHLNKITGYNIQIIDKKEATDFNNRIFLDCSNRSLPEEGYELLCDSKGITISGSTSKGIFYGIQTLFQLLPPQIYSGRRSLQKNITIPYVSIADYPVMKYRGMMLDVSRTFFGKSDIIRLLDWLSYHKVNKFHWHLTDDNGWRIEIKKYPYLTSKGAWRGPGEVLPETFGSGDKRYGGYYTQKDIKEIVKYASDRNIEIIPEIDLPGHSKAVTASYPDVLCNIQDTSISVQGEKKNVWCVGNENNYKMLNNIIKEIAALFPSKYIHIGGDEVNISSWERCPDCQGVVKREGLNDTKHLLNHFVNRMEVILHKHGKYLAGWDEIAEEGKLDNNTRVYAWRGVKKGVDAANKGAKVIMLPGEFFYLDMKQSPVERGHNWAGIVTLEKSYSFDLSKLDGLDSNSKDNFEGIQGALWTELLGSPARFLDYQTFPRMAAIAERGWSSAACCSYKDFYERLTKYHYDRMFNMDIAFRIAPPSATFTNGKIVVDDSCSTSVVRYTSNETEPNVNSPIYKGEIYTNTPERFRFKSFFGNYISSATVMVQNVDYKYKDLRVSVSTSMDENPKFPLKNLTDNKASTYFRSNTKVKSGDYLTYTLDSPVIANRITVETGIPNITFYGVNYGYVEYSQDGVNFIKAGDFINNSVVFNPSFPVQYVRLVITKPNDGYILALQDLKVE